MAGACIDPYGQSNFLIEIDGITRRGFSEASGLTTDTNIIEYREGNEQHGTVCKLPFRRILTPGVYRAVQVTA